MAASRAPGHGVPARRRRHRSLDVRPHVLMPGLVDLHAHLPQIPHAGLGSGLDLLTWLDRYIFPLERAYDRSVAEHQAPLAFRAFAAAGTTTVVAYAALWEDSTDAAFAAAEAHGIRAVIGKVMMDRLSYDTDIDPGEILETSLRQSDELASRWHGADAGRLSYAFTPRFAVSCSADMLRESATLAATARRVLADAPQRGRRRDRGGRPPLSRGTRLSRRLRPCRCPRGPHDPGARHPPVAARGPAPGRERGARGALPGIQPVPVERHDAARPVSRGRHEGGAGERRRRRPGDLDLQRHACRCGDPARAGAHRRRGPDRCAPPARLDPARDAGGSAGAGTGGDDRLPGGWAARRTSSRSTRASRARFRPTIRRRPRTTSPAGSCSGRTPTWCEGRGCAGACSPGRRVWRGSARLGAWIASSSS